MDDEARLRGYVDVWWQAVDDSTLDAAEHAVLVDLTESQPDHRLPFPVLFVRDPELTTSGTGQAG